MNGLYFSSIHSAVKVLKSSTTLYIVAKLNKVNKMPYNNNEHEPQKFDRILEREWN